VNENLYNNGDAFFDIEKSKQQILLIPCLTPKQNKLFRDTINTFHSYVKYKDSPTRNLRYLVYEGVSGNHVGAVGLSSATIAVACRDAFVGWDNKTKMRHLNKLANNSRFCLIKENTTLKNVASMCLRQLREVGAKDWLKRYNDPLILLETFVQPDRDTSLDGHTTRNGSCYRSDNWLEVGMTSGSSIQKSPLLLWAKETGERGRLARENREECLKIYGKYLGEHNGSGYKVTESKKKIVFVRPLVHNWKNLLNHE
jgi:hypothetical protein